MKVINAFFLLALILFTNSMGLKKPSQVFLESKTKTSLNAKGKTSALPSNAWVIIKNKGTGKCLRLIALNLQMTAADCLPWHEGAWKIIPKDSSGSLFNILNRFPVNAYIDNYANLPTNGNGIFSWIKHGGIQQDWKIESNNDIHKLVSAGTGKCITVEGTKVVQNDCNNSDAQQFEILEQPAPQPAQIQSSQWHTIVHAESGKCVRFRSINVPLELDDCQPREQFLWNFSFSSVDGSYFITSKIGNYLFDNFAKIPTNGNLIHSWVKHGDTQQNWYLKNYAENKFGFVMRDTGKCMDLSSTALYTKIREWDCNDNTAPQIFSVIPAPEYTEAQNVPLNSWTQIVNRENGLCMKFVAINFYVQQAPCGTGNEFLWNVSYNSWDNTYFVASKIGNFLLDNYAALQHNGNIVHSWTRHGGVQQFIHLQPQNDGSFAFVFKNSLNKCARAQNDLNLSNIVSWDCDSNYGKQFWKFNPIQSNISEIPPPLQAGNWFRIKNKASGRCMVYNAAATLIQNVDCMNAPEFRWNFSWNTWDGSFFITNAVSDNNQVGFLFDNYAALTHNGNGIFSWPKHGGIQQHFILKKVGEDYQIAAKSTGKCVQLLNGNTENYNTFVQWDCNSSNNAQLFSIEAIPKVFQPYGGFVNQWVQIVNKATGKCIKYKGYAIPLVQETCGNDDDFYFNISHNTWADTYFITSKKDSRTLLDLYANIRGDATNIFSWPRHGGVQQNWVFRDYEEQGFFRIVSEGQAKCITVPNANQNDGANIQSFTCNPNANEQAWNFVYNAPPRPIPNFAIKGSIRNATNNVLIPEQELTSGNISVVFFNPDTNTSVNAVVSGSYYTVTLPRGNYIRTASLNGYVISRVNYTADASGDDSNGNNTVLLSPIVTGLRVVLTWGAAPKDLDAHIFTPAGEMIYYSHNRSQDSKTTLDVDNREGFGPETITVLDGALPGLYKYYVNRYSNDGRLIDSKAKVVVYIGDRQVRDFSIPTDFEDKKVWHVFDYLNTNAQISDVNKLKDAFN